MPTNLSKIVLFWRLLLTLLISERTNFPQDPDLGSLPEQHLVEAGVDVLCATKVDSLPQDPPLVGGSS